MAFGLSSPRSLVPRLTVDVRADGLRLLARVPPGDLPWRAAHPARSGRVEAALLDPATGEVVATTPFEPPSGTGGPWEAVLPAVDPASEWVGLAVLGARPEGSDEVPYLVPVGQVRAGGLVDAHAHLGRLRDDVYPPGLLSALLDEGHVVAAFVSNLDGSTLDQVEANRRMLAWAAAEPRIRPVFWANPHEGVTPAVKGLLESGRFFGIKLHPMLNEFRADDPGIEPYLRIAARRSLFVVFHTDTASPARPRLIERWASRFDEVSFVLGHTGLRGAWPEAIRLVESLPNVHGDLAWFGRFDLLARSIERGFLDRYLFGSDAPVDGEESYQQYMAGLMSLGLGRAHLDQLLRGRALSVLDRP